MAASRHRGQLRYAPAAPGPRPARRALLVAGVLGALLAVVAERRGAPGHPDPAAASARAERAPSPSPTLAESRSEPPLVLEVVDPDGAPVLGATLFVAGRPLATTDQRGLLRGLPASLPSAELRAEGFEPTPLPPTLLARRIVLARGRRVVRVVDLDGRPVPHADLVLDDGTTRQAHRTDASGKHEISTSFAGVLTAHDARLGASARPVTPGPAELVVALAPGAPVDVEVRDVRGAPIAGAPVWWRATGVPLACEPPAPTAQRTDTTGGARLAVPALPGEVCAEQGSGLRACAPSRGQVIRLTVAPVVCVEVVAVAGRDRAPQRGFARVVASGGYVRGLALPGRLDDVPAGVELDLEVDVPGFGAVRERRPATSKIELDLPSPAQLALDVEGPPDAFPARLSLAGPERREVELGAPGPVSLEALAPGPYTLSLSGTMGDGKPLEVVLGPGEQRSLGSVRLVGGGAVEVRGRGWVSLRVEATGALASVADLGAGGVRQFTGLPEGWMTVLTRAGRGWSQASRVWVAPGSATIVELEAPATP